MNIEELKSELFAGVAMQNRYRVSFDSGNRSKIDVLCDSVSMPGRAILTTERYTSSKAYKMPYAYSNEDVMMTFIVENNWYVYNWLQDQYNKIIEGIGLGDDGPSNAKFVRFKDEFKQDFTIETLNQEGKSTKTIKIMNAFLTGLQTIELSNAGSEIIRVNCTWSYDDWKDQRLQFV